MWKFRLPDYRTTNANYRLDDYKSLLRYVNQLAKNKLGYPVSLLTYLGIVNNSELGIKKNTLANILLNNVGDPFKDSETSLLEVKKHEREIIRILERYYGLQPGDGRGYVTTGGTEGNFASLWWSKRYLINKAVDGLIEHDKAIKVQLQEELELEALLAKTPYDNYKARSEYLQRIVDLKNVVSDNRNIIQQLTTPTVFYCKGHTHYSIPKISEVLKLNIRPVQPNDDGSISLEDLKKEIILHVGAHPFSSVIVIANIGTTITGAIDDVLGMKKILDEILVKTVYTIHLDGALTGFVLPVMKPYGDIPNYFDALGVNTIAFSAHKYPGMSQPCGIVLAPKFFFDKAFEKAERNVDYVGNINDVTITGSRSGLNVLMFYNALISLGVDKDNSFLEKMVNTNLENATYLKEKLIAIYGAHNVLHPHNFNVLFPRPSKKLAQKYQLMLTGERATICVLSNVTKKLIDEFIIDLKADKEMGMSNTKTKLDYKIVTLQEEHLKAATEVFIKTFCDSEPITKHINIKYQDYEPFAKEVMAKAIKEGLSKVAVDNQNHVIAVAVAEDLAEPFAPNVKNYPALAPIFGIINDLSTPFTKGRKFVKGKIIHLWIAAVSEKYRGLGLSTIIDMACIEGAAKRGFDYAYAEFTNELSEKVTSQFKILQLYNKIKYNDYIGEDGRAPFKGLEGAAAAYVATIKPGIKLNALSQCYTVTEKC